MGKVLFTLTVAQADVLTRLNARQPLKVSRDTYRTVESLVARALVLRDGVTLTYAGQAAASLANALTPLAMEKTPPGVRTVRRL